MLPAIRVLVGLDVSRAIRRLVAIVAHVVAVAAARLTIPVRLLLLLAGVVAATALLLPIGLLIALAWLVLLLSLLILLI